MRSALVLTLALWCIGSVASAQTCYQDPFSTSTITDPWGCLAACGRTTPHRGTDFGVRCGSAIPAIADGVVIANQHSSCLGWVVAIQHPDGMVSGYSHQDTQSPVPVGTHVTRGQIIGHSGRAGSCANGCHLHLTLGPTATSWYVGGTIDPVAYIAAHAAGSTCADGGGALTEDVATYAPPSTTDLDGDGQADLCARASDGVHCLLTGDGTWTATPSVLGLTNAAGWNRPEYYATMRMADVDGDGRADLCARSASAFHCARSDGTGLGPLEVWFAGMADASGWNRPEYYTTIRLADVDGDGRADLCARDSVGFHCNLSDGHTFARRIEGPAWTNASGYDHPEYFGTIRMLDLDGDGRADTCIRNSLGIRCSLSDGNGFPTTFDGPVWSNEHGFSDVQYWSTLRAGDVDGDGMDDLCIRTGSDLRCALSTGTGFGETLTVAALSDAAGWNDPANYRTLRMGDVNGDGSDDLCARANTGVLCWAWDGAAFVRMDGPPLSDASGWGNTPAYYATMRMADVDGDARTDVCARSSVGWRCTLANGGFTDHWDLDFLTNASGWDSSASYWSTIQSGGACQPRMETCDATDQDCDGRIDEGTCIDAAREPDAGATPDASTTTRDASRADAGMHAIHVSSGCSCAVTGARTHESAGAVLAIACAVWARRRRAARTRRGSVTLPAACATPPG